MLIRILVQRVGPNVLDMAIAASRDSCTTNGAALRAVRLSALPNLLDIMCFSHTLHNCAKHMQLEALEAFLTPWFTLMSHSHRAKSIWRELIQEAPVLFSKVRWWSRMECAMQLARFFAFLEDYVAQLETEHVGDNTTKTLRAILNQKQSLELLQIELAVVLDCSIFCERTYRLEGDRLELFLLRRTSR